ncbi:MAG: hypothetical protein ACC645_03005 [Pirellulales bacterium]
MKQGIEPGKWSEKGVRNRFLGESAPRAANASKRFLTPFPTRDDGHFTITKDRV